LYYRIGSGTGIFTRALLKHPEWANDIAALRAVEPSDGMRQVFNETVKDERALSVNGTFDTTGIESGWADVVIIAQVRFCGLHAC
jgi:phospholipid N-methyltransferase